MAKKGVSSRRTSGITPSQVMAELTKHDFMLLTGATPPSTAFRKTVSATRNRFGADVATSRTGRSVTMVRDGVSVLLPVGDHLTDNALKAIQQKTGVDLSHLEQKRSLPSRRY